MATAVVPWLVAFLLLAVAAEAAPPPSTPGCTDQLISFSPCLSYVSSPPNNLTDAASATCCNAFSSAFRSGAAVCFCYLLRDPQILGFPLNSTRVLSLSSVCPPAPVNGSFPPTPALNFLCSESPALPPLNSAETLGNGITTPSNTESRDPGSSGRMLPKSGEGSPSREDGGEGKREGAEAGTAFWFPLIDGDGHVRGTIPSSSSTQSVQIRNTKSWILPGILTILFTLLNTV